MERFNLFVRPVVGGLLTLLVLILPGCSKKESANAATGLTKTLVMSGFADPLFVTAAPNDTSRLFVVEQGGTIRIIKNGIKLTRPFINITSLVLSNSSERGLLGLAFHPNFATNRYFYVDYTRQTDGATVIARYQCSATDPDSAVVTSDSIFLTIPQPYANHNGGMLAFGPNDGYLYVGMGDGGSGGDPENRAQDSTVLLGKILRLDVDRANGTLIPNSNPFVGRAGWRGEIWAYGVRNPWRFSFDRANGDLYIADVGQGAWEEVDYQPASSTGGENYGWRLKEGTHCYNPSTNCDPGGLTDPVYEYGHTSGRCSITGGYVYRGCAIPDLNGTYFFGDYCSGNIYSFTKNAGGIATFTDHTTELGSLGMSISSFGQDAAGEIYIVDYSGSIYKIVPNGTPSQCNATPCCEGTTGNVNLMGIVDLSDLSMLVSYLTGGGVTLPCYAEANVDNAGLVDLTDLSRLVSFLTGGGATLATCA